MDITRWSIPKSDWLYSLEPKIEKFYTVSKIRYSQHGSGHELLIAKFRLKLNKVGKTTRPFRYDLNQIPYDYLWTIIICGLFIIPYWLSWLLVEVTNRLKRLDLIEWLNNYGQRFMTLYRRQGSRPSPRKRNAKRQNSCLTRPYK